MDKGKNEKRGKIEGKEAKEKFLERIKARKEEIDMNVERKPKKVGENREEKKWENCSFVEKYT